MEKTYISEEVEISIIEFCRMLLRRWYVVLVFALACACALSGYKYYSDSKSFEGDTEPDTKSEEALENSLSDEELVNVKDLVMLKRYIDKAETYLHDSAYMKVNGFDEEVVMNSFYISADGLSTTDKERIHDSVLGYVKSSQFANQVKKEIGWKYATNYVAELISADDKYTVYADGTQGDAISNILHVNVIVPNDTDPEKIMEAVENVVLRYDIQNKKYEDKFKISKEAAFVRTKMDQPTVDSQTGILGSLNTRKTELKNKVGDLKGESYELYKLYTSDEAEAKSDSAEKKPAKHAVFSKKHFVLGFAAGLFVCAVLLLIRYILFPVVSAVTSVERLDSRRYAGRISKSGDNAEDVATIVGYKLKHLAENGSAAVLCWSDILPQHKTILEASFKGYKIIEVPADNGGEVYRLIDGVENAVLVLEDERTPIERLRAFVELMNDCECSLAAYLDME